jgi:hypothetical protein
LTIAEKTFDVDKFPELMLYINTEAIAVASAHMRKIK